MLHPNAKLEERTFTFAQQTVRYCQNLPKTLSNLEIAKQLVRSAGSVGANYIEANEACSKKDFLHRVKITRKEAKESEYWIRLTIPKTEEEESQRRLLQEACELRKIFSAILIKCE
ncbi:MAG: four helix bundle protein [bacterium]